MKRSGPPPRKKPLRRSSAGLRRSEGLKRTSGPKRSARREKAAERAGPLSPEEWRLAVWKADGRRCIVSGLLIRDASRPINFHHPYPKQLLPAAARYDPRNGVTVTPDVHANHESASRRIPYEKLPQRVKDFVAELGPAAEDRLRRYHPTTQEVD